MIEGFENALDAFIERQSKIDEVQSKINGINGKRDAELEEIDAKISTLNQIIADRDNTHREYLEKHHPEAFQGYGGQTPQYEDYYIYGPTEKENEEYKKLFKERKEILDKYAEISLL